MTDAPPVYAPVGQDSHADDLATSLHRLESALDRIAFASAAAQLRASEEEHVVETVIERVEVPAALASGDGVSAHLAGRLDSMIARLRTVIDNGEESTAWLRSA